LQPETLESPSNHLQTRNIAMGDGIFWNKCTSKILCTFFVVFVVCNSDVTSIGIWRR